MVTKPFVSWYSSISSIACRPIRDACRRTRTHMRPGCRTTCVIPYTATAVPVAARLRFPWPSPSPSTPILHQHRPFDSTVLSYTSPSWLREKNHKRTTIHTGPYSGRSCASLCGHTLCLWPRFRVSVGQLPRIKCSLLRSSSTSAPSLSHVLVFQPASSPL